MFLSEDLNQYILDHTSPEDEVLNELDRETNLTCLYSRMISGHVQGKILQMICHMIKPRRVLELGTFTGYSAISMALAMDEGTILHTIEISDEREEIIQKFIEKAGLRGKVICHIGDAKELVDKFEEPFDLVFIDADKRDYPEYYQLVFDKVKPGGYIIADNILWDAKVVDPACFNEPQTKSIMDFNDLVQNDNRVENVIFPFRDGMMVIRKKEQ
jgi:caffeoyl-CoA O-methyltransferase